MHHVIFLWNNSSVSLKCAVISNLVFWPLSIFGLYVDYLVATRRSPALIRYKLQPNHSLCRREILDMVMLAAFNMLIVAPLVCPLFEYIWDCIQGSNRLASEDEWIWQQEILIKLPLQFLVTEVGFYTVHILLHYSTFLYHHIHRVHHRFIAPTVMTCVYAHPLEYIVGNIFPIYLSCMLMNAHPVTCYVWFPLAMAGTCKGHCGYQIMGVIDPHDVHHLYFRYNFGGMALLDWMFGTLLVQHPVHEKNT